MQIKQCTEFNEDLKQIHNILKHLKSTPFMQSKIVEHKPPSKKVKTNAIAQLVDT